MFFFQTAETGKRTSNSGVKGSGPYQTGDFSVNVLPVTAQAYLLRCYLINRYL